MVPIADEISLSPPDTAARPGRETHMSPWVQQVTKTTIIAQHKTTTKKKMPKIDILDALDDEITSILNTL